ELPLEYLFRLPPLCRATEKRIRVAVAPLVEREIVFAHELLRADAWPGGGRGGRQLEAGAGRLGIGNAGTDFWRAWFQPIWTSIGRERLIALPLRQQLVTAPEVRIHEIGHDVAARVAGVCLVDASELIDRGLPGPTPERLAAFTVGHGQVAFVTRLAAVLHLE